MIPLVPIVEKNPFTRLLWLPCFKGSKCWNVAVFADVNEAAPAFRRSPEQTGGIQSGSIDGSARASSSSARIFTRSQTNVGNQKRHPGVLHLRVPPLTCSRSCTAALKPSLLRFNWFLQKWNRRCFWAGSNPRNGKAATMSDAKSSEFLSYRRPQTPSSSGSCQ